VFRRRWLELVTSTVAIAAIAGVLVAARTNNDLQRLNDALMNRISQLESQVELQRTLFAVLTSPDVRVVTLGGQGAHARARGRIFWDQARRRWLVYVRGLSPVPGNLTYQLWFVPGTGNPVSAGTFNTETDGSQQLNIALQEGLTDLKAAAVTTEPAPGLPQPSGAFALLSE
jgi:anti-sigma-K factor RskA